MRVPPSAARRVFARGCKFTLGEKFGEPGAPWRSGSPIAEASAVVSVTLYLLYCPRNEREVLFFLDCLSGEVPHVGGNLQQLGLVHADDVLAADGTDQFDRAGHRQTC